MPKSKKTAAKPEVTVDQVLDYLRCNGSLGPAVSDVARREFTAAAAAKKGIKVSDDELQKASNAWRTMNQLYSASDTEKWLKNAGLSLESYESYLETSLLVSKFKQSLAAEAKIEKIFNDPVCQDRAVDLLYADWLASASR